MRHCSLALLLICFSGLRFAVPAKYPEGARPAELHGARGAPCAAWDCPPPQPGATPSPLSPSTARCHPQPPVTLHSLVPPMASCHPPQLGATSGPLSPTTARCHPTTPCPEDPAVTPRRLPVNSCAVRQAMAARQELLTAPNRAIPGSLSGGKFLLAGFLLQSSRHRAGRTGAIPRICPHPILQDTPASSSAGAEAG